jgi:phosphoribosylanthranilate isomerase
VIVKVCGVRTAADALLAAELGAWAVGFVFWPGSPRFIDPYRAREIAAMLPAWVTPVGVFVDQPADYVAGVAGLVRLGAVQLHGSEQPLEYARLRHRIIKSVPVGMDFNRRTVSALPDSVTVLLDAHDPVRKGGTGRTIDWTHAAAAAAMRPVFLSGGLTPDNVGEAIARVRPRGIDVSSGVERSPGLKDAAKLRALFAAIRD